MGPIGRVFNIQRYSLYDGAGVRTVMFLKGCPLRCLWCANPEGISPEVQLMLSAERCTACGECVRVCPQGAHSLEGGQHLLDRSKCTRCGRCAEDCLQGALTMCGREMTVQEAVETLMRDEPFFRTSGGGVTIGGGEALMQPEFAAAVLEGCKAYGVNTAIETCGYATEEAVEAVRPFTDEFLYDIKAIDPDVHRKLTGKDNARILSNLRRILSEGARVRIRMPLIHGLNDDMEMIRRTMLFVREISGTGTLTGIDLLPYHSYGVMKYGGLGLEYELSGRLTPTEAELEEIRDIMSLSGVGAAIVRHRMGARNSRQRPPCCCPAAEGVSTATPPTPSANLRGQFYYA